jgi:hypothetical protein
MASKPIKNDPINNMKWPDKGRKNQGLPGKGPIKGDPVKNFGWPTGKGRKNEGM